MISTQLITLADIRASKSIALNVNQEKELVPYILEAQNFDLLSFMGDAFFLDLVDDFNSSPSLDKYIDLFNGVTYAYQGSNYILFGLKEFLIYNCYARYLANSNVIATPTGMVHKTNQYSEGVSEKTIARLVEQARAGAKFHEQNVRDYLCRKSVDYPLWTLPQINRNTNRNSKIRQV